LENPPDVTLPKGVDEGREALEARGGGRPRRFGQR
jgi:hypothetical protein